MQTFRHTVELARNGRNEEALLGCDFILKMDARFQPARKLLETLRGVAAGTVVDLSPFADFLPGAPAAAAPARPTGVPGGTVAIPSVSLKPGGGLDDLSFDDFGSGGDPFGAPPPTLTSGAPLKAPAPAPAPPPPPPPAFGDPFAAPAPAPQPFKPSAPDPFAAPPTFGAPPPDPFAAPSAFDAPPAFSAAPDPFAAPPAFAPPPAFADPFAAPAGGGAGLDDLGFGQPPAFAPAAPPAPPEFGDPFAGQPGPGAMPSLPSPPSYGPSAGPAVDPRITQFLRQGDDAMARGHVQEAIDLWSRVFLIDLSNEEASRRIDGARDAQADNARRVDTLLQEAILQFEAGDLAGAKVKFLEVLSLSENDATAKSYLNQIDSTQMAEQPPDMRGASTDFMKDELEVPSSPSFAAPDLSDEGAPEMPAEQPEETARERPAPKVKGGGMDARVLVAAGLGALLVIGGGAYLALKKKSPPPTPTPSTSTQSPGTGAAGTAAAAADQQVAKAEALIGEGKCPEALVILTDIPVSDAMHAKALELIERCKNAPPVASTPNLSAAELEKLRVDGLAYYKSYEFIKAVQALDPYVKSHPDDSEAAEALTKSRERVVALGSAVKSFNEQDYESAIKMLWEIKKGDAKAQNQDVDEYLFKSYFNDGVQNLQAGNSVKAATAFQEAVAIRPKDEEAQRHLKFAKKYKTGTNDLLSRIYVKHVTPRQ